MTDNLLETIIKEKKSEELSRLDAINIVNSLFSDLLDREKDILSRRFGLKGEKSETLEKIGQMHKLTRERVRQIEVASLKKIKKLDKLQDSIATLKTVVKDILNDHGGLISREYLLDILTVICFELNDDNKPNLKQKTISEEEYQRHRLVYRNHFNFLLSKLMEDDLEFIKDSEHFQPIFKHRESDTTALHDLAQDLLAKVDNLKKVFTTKELLDLLKSLDSYNKHQLEAKNKNSSDISSIFESKTFNDEADVINQNKILYALMQSVRNLKQNQYGEWGLADWPEISPKTVNDKIYLVLKHSGKPLHFTKIAEEINKMKFDHKIANPATVHNELILDKRYVLVGRGIYALKDWKNKVKK